MNVFDKLNTPTVYEGELTMATVTADISELCKSANNARHPGLRALGTLVVASLLASCGFGAHVPAITPVASSFPPAPVPSPPPTPTSTPPAPAPTPNLAPPATVTVVISSDANDQLSELFAVIDEVTLYDAEYNPQDVWDGPRTAEFIHVNGGAEPSLTTSIAQGVYTSAQMLLEGVTFACAGVSQGALSVPSFGSSQNPRTSIQVELPEPITVSGQNIVLTLKLHVSQSFYYSDTCSAGDTFSSSPIFSLTAAPMATDPTTPASGALSGIAGQVTMLNAASNGFGLQLPTASVAQLSTIPVPPPGSDTPPVTMTTPAYVNVVTDGNTQWQGISDLSALTPGMFVNLDGAIQDLDTVRATRIAVEDPAAQNVRQGPLLSVSSTQPAVAEMLPVLGQGTDETLPTEDFAFSSSTRFQMSGQFSNLGTLPFAPVFSAATALPGQNISISAPAFDMNGTFGYSAVANTATLMPQTVSGAVVGTSSSGAFTVYQISLPAYDPFSILETQTGQTPLLSNLGVMYVYADSSTLMLNSQAPATGDTLRFYGLVFNDGGVLRMDCARIDDGASTTGAR